MKVVIISDIHIFGPDDPLYESLLALMREELLPGDHLVLAGDIFDFFVGNQPTQNRRYSAFFDLLGVLGRQDIHTTYIEGNHDFHLGSVFSEIPNLRIAHAEVEISTPRKQLYIAHGDLVDREDRGYLALRTLFRSPITRFAAFALPEAVVEWIGNRSADSSRKRNPRLPESQGGRRLLYLRKTFRDFARRKFAEGFDAVVLGHCHDLDGEEITVGGRKVQYMNVGYPRVHHEYIVFSEETGLQRKRLRRFDH